MGRSVGTRFSVWAPNAQAVRLVGDFNYWNGEGHYMQLVPGSGVWALFVEGASTGSLYKFEVLGADGVWRLKADPMARFAEAAPHTASIVYESQYAWGDDDWMWYRGQRSMHAEPMTIYEVHIGSLAYRAHLPRAGQRTGRVRQLAGATRMWNSCRLPSIRSKAPGATTSPATTHRCRSSGRRTSSGTSSTSCTRPGSA